MYGVIYKYTNKFNGKVYIGQTVNEHQRKIEHKCHSKTRPFTQSAFYNAIDKYGWDNFHYSVLETVEAETLKELKFKLNLLEIKYIQQYNSCNNGYNMHQGGDFHGHKAKAILEYDIDGNLLNRYTSYLHIPIKESMRRNIWRACSNNKATFMGHLWRFEDNDLTKMPFIEGAKSKYTYFQWTKNQQLVREWPSVVIAQKEGSFDPSAVIKCCLGKLKSHKGFIWTRKLKN